jgi:hypothetical protein
MMQTSLFAQENSEINSKTELVIKLVSKPYGDSIRLRWAPTTLDAFEIGKNGGYELYRETYARDGVSFSKNERQGSIKKFSDSFKVREKEDWKEVIYKDSMAFLAAGLLYDESEPMTPPSSPTDIKGMYRQSQLEASKFAYILYSADHSILAAEYLGLSVIDTDVKPNESYRYYIEYRDQSNPKYSYKRAGEIVHENTYIPLPIPVKPEAKSQDKSVRINWTDDDMRAYFISYDIERYDDSLKEFKKINKSPIINVRNDENDNIVSYNDKIGVNNESFIYRIIGKSLFGEYSIASDTVIGMGEEPIIRARPQISNAIEFPKGNMQVRWVIDLHDDASKIKGFNVLRSESVHKNKPFEKLNEGLLGPEEHVFTDSLPLMVGYYKIELIDTNGNKQYSEYVLAQMEDLLAPEPPVNLKGELNPENGEVSLHWTPNTEEDLRGYRVFFSNQKEGNFHQVTDKIIRDTSYTYTVTMNTLSEEVYFKVIAVDFRHNFSLKSEVCIVKRPDDNPPTAPVIKLVINNEKSIDLKIAGSSSKDVVAHRIERRAVSSVLDEWMTIERDTTDWYIINYSDTTAQRGIIYEYQIVAEDDAELEGVSKSAKGKVIDKGVREEIVNFSLLKQEEKIELEWMYPVDANVRKYVVYRSKNGSSPRTYKVLTPDDLKKESMDGLYVFNFEDERISSGLYSYQIIAQHEDGGQSPLSEKQSLEIKD